MSQAFRSGRVDKIGLDFTVKSRFRLFRLLEELIDRVDIGGGMERHNHYRSQHFTQSLPILVQKRDEISSDPRAALPPTSAPASAHFMILRRRDTETLQFPSACLDISRRRGRHQRGAFLQRSITVPERCIRLIGLFKVSNVSRLPGAYTYESTVAPSIPPSGVPCRLKSERSRQKSERSTRDWTGNE